MSEPVLRKIDLTAMWELAEKKAQFRYENEGYGCWEDADKYEREDFVSYELFKIYRENGYEIV